MGDQIEDDGKEKGRVGAASQMWREQDEHAVLRKLTAKWQSINKEHGKT